MSKKSPVGRASAPAAEASGPSRRAPSRGDSPASSARRADATARSTFSAPATCTVASSSPVAGSRVSSVSPESDSTKSLRRAGTVIGGGRPGDPALSAATSCVPRSSPTWVRGTASRAKRSSDPWWRSSRSATRTRRSSLPTTPSSGSRPASGPGTGASVRVARRLRAGTAWRNCHGEVDPAAPLGGHQASGHGREMGSYALELYPRGQVRLDRARWWLSVVLPD